MQEYELTIQLSEKTPVAKKKMVIEKVDKLLNSLKGKLNKFDDWGVMELTTHSKKEGSGIFLHFNLELMKENTRKLEDKLRLDDDIIRHLLVRSEE